MVTLAVDSGVENIAVFRVSVRNFLIKSKIKKCVFFDSHNLLAPYLRRCLLPVYPPIYCAWSHKIQILFLGAEVFFDQIRI
jgi:hypothetical protein